MMARLWALRRSLMVQMTILTIVFIAWGAYAFAIRPILEMSSRETVPATQATGQAVQNAIWTFVRARTDGTVGPDALANDPTLRAVAAKNPDFRYFVKVGDEEFGNAPARYYRRFGLDRVEALRRSLPNLGMCTTAGDIHKPEGPGSYADFVMCKRVQYLEYRGLTQPTIANADYTPLYAKWLTAFSGEFLVAALGVFLIFAVLIGVLLRQVRRITKVTASFDPRSLHATLPEDRLATEIQPLVRAVNLLLTQAREQRERNDFFLSAAAHEMRTPLTVLRTRVELLEPGALKDRLVGDLRRVNALVNRLLELMRIGDDRRGFAPLDLVALTRQAVHDARSIAGDRDIRVVFRTAIARYDMHGDRALIRSAILNLVENAMGVSPNHGTVVVAVEEEGVVSVADEGPGLPAGDSEALFQPFVRFPVSPQGFGLGLAIVQAVAHLHGGWAKAETPGTGGAIFRLCLIERPDS